MRVATTASPVSGSEVRERMETLALRSRVQNSVRVIGAAWRRYQQQKTKASETMDHSSNKQQSERTELTLSLIPPFIKYGRTELAGST